MTILALFILSFFFVFFKEVFTFKVFLQRSMECLVHHISLELPFKKVSDSLYYFKPVLILLIAQTFR